MFRHAFTLVDLLLLVIALGIVATFLLALSQPVRRVTTRQMKESTQVRGIGQAMTLFAQNNQGLMPLPSELDVAGDTVAGPAAAKDTSANIISTLIWNGFLSTDFFVSNAESNQRIRIDDDYMYTEPKSAVNPRKALWDPAFSADFTRVGPPVAAGIATSYAANLSYAIRPSWSAARRLRFDTMDPAIAVVGNRGPEITNVTYDKRGSATSKRASLTSNTNLIHGGRNTWEGYIVYADNSANLETTVAPERMTYTNAQGTKLGDVLFYDEASDMTDTNNYLGIFTATGSTRGEWKAIWD
jgi:type II secretory pathway pseudopilin PulG